MFDTKKEAGRLHMQGNLSREKGLLALVLHSHLPYSHHPESEKVMEERWLFEAAADCYLPLLEVMEGLARDGIGFRLTMSLSPTLVTMLANPLLQERCLQHLDRTVGLAEREVAYTAGNPELHRLADRYLERYIRLRDKWIREYDGNLLHGFRRLAQAGHLELMTSSMTHAFLPYVRTEQAVRAQLENAVAVHAEHLGEAPRGIWLPECGYREGLDRLLREAGFEYFVTDAHAHATAAPNAPGGVLTPLRTPHGIAAFARDHAASRQVWSSVDGYPGDPDYREFYRDAVYEREEAYIAPYLHPCGLRLDSGFKYWRITGGEGEQKQLYVPERASEKAARHAEHFLHHRIRQAVEAASHMERQPLITAAYDTELFGHWWHEGPVWLDYLCRKIHYDQDTIRLASLGDYLDLFPDRGVYAEPSFSSWGRGGYGEVWLGERNEWMYRRLHRMEEDMIRLADTFPDAGRQQRRALDQAGRELLLAQSSDWAFIMDGGTVVDYAVRRFKEHAGRFLELAEMLRHGRIDERRLQELERRDAIAPGLDFHRFRSAGGDPEADIAGGGAEHGLSDEARAEAFWEDAARGGLRAAGTLPLKVLMLSWEFPPMTVGGLSRHVFDLSRALVRQGIEVHVVTSHVDGYPAYEVNQGVKVHRVRTFQARELDFMGWVFQLNLAMIDYARSLIANHVAFDVLHAHDWLVAQAALVLKRQFDLPLTATIHATEHGRNSGLRTGQQQHIHGLERELMLEAGQVICCSRYMREVLPRLFGLPEERLSVIPNGVDAALLQTGAEAEENIRRERDRFALPHEKIVLFIGRLVHEKGVQVLIESVPKVLAACPEAKFVIAGTGPTEGELRARVAARGLGDKVLFAGFVDDAMRNRLLRLCSAAVFPSLYEPFGIVTLEAMSAGAPVVVSGTGGLADIVSHGEDGLTALPGVAESLAEQVAAMLSDEANARRMAKRALAKVKARYDWNRLAVETAQIYLRAIGEAEGNSKETAAAAEK